MLWTGRLHDGWGSKNHDEVNLRKDCATSKGCQIVKHLMKKYITHKSDLQSQFQQTFWHMIGARFSCNVKRIIADVTRTITLGAKSSVFCLQPDAPCFIARILWHNLRFLFWCSRIEGCQVEGDMHDRTLFYFWRGIYEQTRALSWVDLWRPVNYVQMFPIYLKVIFHCCSYSTVHHLHFVLRDVFLHSLKIIENFSKNQNQRLLASLKLVFVGTCSRGFNFVSNSLSENQTKCMCQWSVHASIEFEGRNCCILLYVYPNTIKYL